MKNYKKNLSTLFIFLLLGTWTNLASAGACTGVGTAASPITAAECETEPDIYKIKVYEMGLCATTPTLANMATACTSVTKISEGGLVTVANGVNSVVPGTFVRPDNGTYAYGYMVIAPEFRITATKTFGSSVTGQAGAGTTCWTLAGSFRDSGATTTYDGSTPTAITAATRGSYLAECGLAANAAPAETVTVQDAFGGSDINDEGLATASATVDGATVVAHLTDSNLALATKSADVAKLVGFVTFATPVTVTDDSATFVSSFKVSQGAQIGYDAINAGSIKYIGSGPFVTKLSVE